MTAMKTQITHEDVIARVDAELEVHNAPSPRLYPGDNGAAQMSVVTKCMSADRRRQSYWKSSRERDRLLDTASGYRQLIIKHCSVGGARVSDVEFVFDDAPSSFVAMSQRMSYYYEDAVDMYIHISLQDVYSIVEEQRCTAFTAASLLVIHEAMHVLLGHFSDSARSMYNVDPFIANLACDYEVNSFCGFDKTPCCHPSQRGYRNWLDAREYFRMLLDDEASKRRQLSLDTTTACDDDALVAVNTDDSGAIVSFDDPVADDTEQPPCSQSSHDVFTAQVSIDSDFDISVLDSDTLHTIDETRAELVEARQANVQKLLSRCSQELREFARRVRADEMAPECTPSSWSHSWRKLSRRSDDFITPGRKRMSGGVGRRHGDIAYVFIDKSPSTSGGLDRMLDSAAAALHETGRVAIAYYTHTLIGYVPPTTPLYTTDTSGGTDFAAALKKLNESGVYPKRAIVLTDGWDPGLHEAVNDGGAELGLDEIEAWHVNYRGEMTRIEPKADKAVAV